MKQALELLRLAAERFPVAGPARHSLSLVDDGRIALWLMLGDRRWQSFVFDAEDLEREPIRLIEEISAMVEDLPPPERQGDEYFKPCNPNFAITKEQLDAQLAAQAERDARGVALEYSIQLPLRDEAPVIVREVPTAAKEKA